ncbi:hypothetical protein LXP63_20630 [Yersinia pestis subsp. pestis]|uniref:Uncharacterized protein n=1 Tax=Yersinia pestis TaxID=632 RepID=Q8CKK9_YERPE|nr:hypothetical protein [Yersinia pestis]AAM86909.1 hypothetical [Yersinia pestis KIM10+]EEO75664.1 hypothetical protein YP516_3597 [Yersinia pestis Nepal516]ADV97519.1 hypothetical protein YPC_0827 [Yersinia pestis biovar Medievalis str. Harbin 35]MCD9430713.1 hypothetical protein [Yersinia pestis]MCF2965635.1 hypothetical protein [Yersinia pestis subsp. pestis]
MESQQKNDCLIMRAEHVNASDYLKLCRNSSSEESEESEESDYFTMNDRGEWEAVTDGIPVLADINVTSKFTGMSAVISCKYEDDAGYHSEQCFQAEINLPKKINFIFTGRGDPSLFNYYKSIYLSFKVR